MYTKDNVLSMIKKIDKQFPTDRKIKFIDYAMNWTNTSWNLGDTAFLSIIPKKAFKANREVHIFSQSTFFEPLMTFNDYYISVEDFDLSNYNAIYQLYDIDAGNGHWLQVQSRAMGFEIDIKPKPYINFKCDKNPNTVLINIEGHSFHYLTDIITPVIQKFVDENNNKFHFVETFAKQSTPHLKNVEYFSLPTEEMIKQFATFEYFIGIDSGPMHIAAALDVKGIIITDKPSIDKLYLPKPNGNINDFGGMSYLYPQNVHLYVNGENELVKCLSAENLLRALNGEIYPYWREDYLDLILEF